MCVCACRLRGYNMNRTADFDTVRDIKEKHCYVGTCAAAAAAVAVTAAEVAVAVVVVVVEVVVVLYSNSLSSRLSIL